MGAMGAIMAGLFFAHEAQGERAYLPTVGSPPLRFVAEATNYFVYDPKSMVLAAKPKDTNSTVTSPMTSPMANATNGVESSSQNPMAATDAQRPSTMVSSMLNENKGSSQRYNSDFSPGAASDLLTVTPQMINEYLKPGRYKPGNGTNQFDQPGAVVFVPAEMQFRPPAPKNSTESQATYRSQ